MKSSDARDAASPSRNGCSYCGYLDWTIAKYGRVTHKKGCPMRRDPWHQGNPTASAVPDLAAIRARADEVLQAMDEDPGPITAEPYAGWAQREALDALSLVDLIEAARG